MGVSPLLWSEFDPPLFHVMPNEIDFIGAEKRLYFATTRVKGMDHDGIVMLWQGGLGLTDDPEVSKSLI